MTFGTFDVRLYRAVVCDIDNYLVVENVWKD
jgi:hypothetical protein